MELAKQILGEISGGKILDVATGSGYFIPFLQKGLLNYSEIIGIDSSSKGEDLFKQSFSDQSNIHFQVCNGLQMDFPDQSFDFVSISNSLHHFDQPHQVLAEMYRVLKPNGHLLVAEMHCDNQNETQMVQVQMHHWWAKIDRSRGVIHNPTLELTNLLMILNPFQWQYQKHFFEPGMEKPVHNETLKELEGVFERYFAWCEDNEELIAEGKKIQKKLHKIGMNYPNRMILLAQKI